MTDDTSTIFHEDGTVTVFGEGLGRGLATDLVDGLAGAAAEIASWFQGADEKHRTFESKCKELIDWLEEVDRSHPDLDLESGAFLTWMKTSEAFRWRYYFLLDDQSFAKIMTAIKQDQRSELEGHFDISAVARIAAARKIDRARKIADLVAIVKLYRDRANRFYKAIQNRRRPIGGAPFQIAFVVGLQDLQSSVKRCVNFAL